VPITPQQIQTAKLAQDFAAHDPSGQIRLVAGPGTGKSFAIEERVHWLLAGGTNPANLFVVSFTRASARDLRARIQRYCAARGMVAGNAVSVTTLHSLALRILQAAGLLTLYPVRPVVMDDWELEHIYDAEFSEQSRQQSRLTPTRCASIRAQHEAYWSTGNWVPPNYSPPSPPITQPERAQFQAFHAPRAQTYSSVLPGEIVRQCLQQIAAGTLNPVAVLGMEHLVVDEYQDLNPADLEFVDHLIVSGVRTFIAGDDDQSIYSFRYASPQGIQLFTTKYPQAGSHDLNDCFRCTPRVLDAAVHVISTHPLPNRIAKNLRSLYTNANPPVAGSVHRCEFVRGAIEARAIADSCQRLIQQGVPPNEILILLSNRRLLERDLRAAFTTAGVDYEAPRADIYRDSVEGRLAVALLRIVCDQNDYVAHRTILGLPQGVGPGTCNAIAMKVIQNSLNFRGIFYAPLRPGVFSTRELRAIGTVRTLVSYLAGWGPNDTLQQRNATIRQLLSSILGNTAVHAWDSVISALPADTTLQEVRDYLWADTDQQGAEVLSGIYDRLALEAPQNGFLPPRVRMMTMHNAKGLSAQVVFIPALEEQVLPGNWRRPYPGLVLEAARLLYVSVSRARAACILSFARRRMVYGRVAHHTPSRFTAALGGQFVQRQQGLTQGEAQAIAAECAQL
jgi:DNA helicase-2/ATP-dependent DNA helicase PcrA